MTTQDCFFNRDDLQNIVGVVNKDLYMKDYNDAKNVQICVRENPLFIFYFQDNNERVEGALASDNMPFVIRIQTKF